MKRLLCSMFAGCLALAMVAGPVPVASAGSSVEVRLKDGSKWRGAVDDVVEITFLQQRVEVKRTGRLLKASDLYVIVEANIAGELRRKTIFRDDVVSMRTVSPDGESASELNIARRRDADADARSDLAAAPGGKRLGVFVLPLEGFVGGPFRREEIEMIGEKADEYGPGQIIVLKITSNGGSSLESQYIAQEIFDLRERHRVVAWVDKAVSAGCQTAMCCEEIYFMTAGTAGAVTTWNPGSGESIKGEELEKAMDHLVEIAEKSGYSEHIARAMKTNSAMCSYDKDDETGEVTFYGDMSGEHILSDDESNLSFNSSNALDCGFSKGTADTVEQLAKLLDLPEWHETSDYGRKIAKSWQDTWKRAEAEVPRLLAEREYKSTSGSAEARLGALIQINQKLIRWYDRCPNYMEGRFPPKDVFVRETAEMRKQLADMRRRR